MHLEPRPATKNALGATANDQNALGATTNDQNALGATTNDQNALGAYHLPLTTYRYDRKAVVVS